MRHTSNTTAEDAATAPLRHVYDDVADVWRPLPAGGADDDDPDDPPADDPPGDDPPGDDPPGDPDDEPLGAAGIRALRAERDRANAAERRLAELERERMTEHERAVAEAADAARQEAAAEAAGAWAPKLARAEFLTLAADTTADPKLAAQAAGDDLVRFVDDDGTVDTAAMADYITTLVTDHPLLAPARGNGGGGGRPNGGPKPPAGERDTPPDLRSAVGSLVAGD